MPSNNYEKEKNTINKIEIKDNSRYVSTTALNTIAKSTSLNVQHYNLKEIYHNSHYSYNNSNESRNTNKTIDQYKKLKELYKTYIHHKVLNSKRNINTAVRINNRILFASKKTKTYMETFLRLPC